MSEYRVHNSAWFKMIVVLCSVLLIFCSASTVWAEDEEEEEDKAPPRPGLEQADERDNIRMGSGGSGGGDGGSTDPGSGGPGSDGGNNGNSPSPTPGIDEILGTDPGNSGENGPGSDPGSSEENGPGSGSDNGNGPGSDNDGADPNGDTPGGDKPGGDTGEGEDTPGDGGLDESAPGTEGSESGSGGSEGGSGSDHSNPGTSEEGENTPFENPLLDALEMANGYGERIAGMVEHGIPLADDPNVRNGLGYANNFGLGLASVLTPMFGNTYGNIVDGLSIGFNAVDYGYGWRDYQRAGSVVTYGSTPSVSAAGLGQRVLNGGKDLLNTVKSGWQGISGWAKGGAILGGIGAGLDTVGAIQSFSAGDTQNGWASVAGGIGNLAGAVAPFLGLTPAGLVVGGVALLGMGTSLVIRNWDSIVNGVRSAVGFVGRGIATGARAVASAASAVGRGIAQGAQAVGRGIVNGTQAAGRAVARGAQAAGRTVVQGAQAAGRAVAQGAQAAVSATANAARNAANAVGNGLRNAGRAIGNLFGGS